MKSMKKIIALLFLLAGCVGTDWSPPEDFSYVQIDSGGYEIATWQKITDSTDSHIHIYIEGDGAAFDAYGQPTSDPTPCGTFVRDLVARDVFANVAYVARPCQFNMVDTCSEIDWTSGRFSKKIIDVMADALHRVGGDKKITLVGYSGGAMVAGLIIAQHPELKIEKWITIAGVLNHRDWTDYFGDESLAESMNLESLPKVAQKHFVGGRDKVVPYDLAKDWANAGDIIIIENATHDNFGNLKIFD